MSCIRSALRVMCDALPLSPIHITPPCQYPQGAQQMPRGHSFPLQYHCAQHRGNAKHLTQDLDAQRVPREREIGRVKSSSQTPREAPAVVVQGIRADMVSSAVAVQVHSSLGAVEARTSKGSIIHRRNHTIVSTGEGDKSRIVQDVLLEMVPKAGIYAWVSLRLHDRIFGHLDEKLAPTRCKIKQDRRTPTASATALFSEDRDHF